MISVIHMDSGHLCIDHLYLTIQMTERYSITIYYLIPNVWYLHASSFDNVPAWEYNSMIVGEHVELLVEEYVGDNHREPPPTSGLSRNVPPCYCSPLPQPLLAGLLFTMYYICIACKFLLLLPSATAPLVDCYSNVLYLHCMQILAIAPLCHRLCSA